MKFAISKGFKKFGFSSHAPIPFITYWTMKHDDFQDYEDEFYRLKAKYADRIELYLGLEVDYIENCTDVTNEFLRYKSLDYIIGSVHYLDRIEHTHYWSIDGNFNEFDNGLKLLFDGDIRQATARYFEILTQMINKGGIDIVGHFDKITLHGRNYNDFDITGSWYTALLGKALEQVKEKGLILEINTKSLRDQGITFPHQRFYPLIHEMQIPVVVNSDCHLPTRIKEGFAPTFKALKKAGFTSLMQLFGDEWKPVEFNEKGLV